MELRIASLLKDGKRSREAAAALGLATPTVIWHRKKIRKKLGIAETRGNILDHLPPLE